MLNHFSLSNVRRRARVVPQARTAFVTRPDLDLLSNFSHIMLFYAEHLL